MNFGSCRLNTREMEKLQKYCKSWKTMQALGEKEEGRAGWGRSQGEALQEGKKTALGVNSSPILSGGTVASSPAACCPRGAWAEKNTHGVDSGSSRVAAEDDSASNKALEVKGSSTRELSEGWLLPACHGTGQGKPPACPHPAWRREKKGAQEGRKKAQVNIPLQWRALWARTPGLAGEP